jgi:predicted MarR family transcription regulator
MGDRINRGSRVTDDFMTRSETAAALTRVELAIVRYMESYDRWLQGLYTMIGRRGLNISDMVLLQTIRMMGTEPDAPELGLFLNRFDYSNIQYSLKKLEQFELIERRSGETQRKTRYALTEAGRHFTTRFARFREGILVAALAEEGEAWEARAHNVSAFLDDLRKALDSSTELLIDRNVLSDSQVKL